MSRIDKSTDREWSTGLGLGAGDTGVTAYVFGASFGHDETPKIGWLYNSVNIVKTTELHTLNE